MPPKSLEAALDRLDELKRSFNEKDRLRAKRTLSQLSRRRFMDAASLIRFHEILLFMRAYPHDEAMAQKTEELLASFHLRVERLLETDAASFNDFSAMEVSGVSGTTLSVNWGYDIARHLAAHHSPDVEVDWEVFESDALLVAVLKNFLPLFEDGAYVEYPVPYREWIRAAKAPDESDLAWLLRQFERLPLSYRNRAALYDGLKLYLVWRLGDSDATRTKMRQPAKRIFYHHEPLIKRGDVSLAREVEKVAPLPVRKLTRAAGEQFIRLARDAMTVRNRELHGFTYGDPEQVVRAEAGRGVEFYVWGVPPAHRLPLLGYHAVLMVKNGVPMGYAESLSLFERTEFGFNLFYSFREGESAWIYARLLRFFRQHLGVTVFSIDPYQIGFHNDEAIDSGAFWFYRKLGFRPTKPGLAKQVEREERKIAARKSYRTPARVLRQLATGHLIYESPGSQGVGDWDAFHLRHIGLAVQKRLVEQFSGDAERFRQSSADTVAAALGYNPMEESEDERRAFSELATALAMVPDLASWSDEDKSAIRQIVRAKAAADESGYVRLLQQHSSLREAIIRIGSLDAECVTI